MPIDRSIDRVKQTSHKQRNLSGFDVAITVLWIGVIVVVNLAGVRQNAPQELKVLMGPGMLILVYSLVWTFYKASSGFGKKRRETR